MLYSEVLKNDKIQRALKAAFVDDVESLAMKDGDFIFDIGKLDDDVINSVIDQEILYRRKRVEYEKRLNELDEKLKPYKKIESKAEYIKPFIEKIVVGKFQHPYSTIESQTIDYLAKTAAQRYDYETTGLVKQEDFSGMSELQKILKQSSIVNLSQKMSIEEIATRTILDANISTWFEQKF